jgi:hypothetical protein
MTQPDPVTLHQQLCDELYALSQEENRFLQQEKRPPDAALLERKAGLLGRLDASLSALRAAPRPDSSRRVALDKARTRIMQILQLDRENEQLLLRYSLARDPSPAVAHRPPAAALDKLYARHP